MSDVHGRRVVICLLDIRKNVILDAKDVVIIILLYDNADNVRSTKPVSCYISPAPAKRNKIEDWHSGLTVKERTDADYFIKTMRQKAEIGRCRKYRLRSRATKAW